MSNLTKLPSDQKDNEPKVSFLMRQRNALGIPEEIKHNPILYMSSHRGTFDVNIEGHTEAFQKLMTDEATEQPEKESIYFDLGKTGPDEIVATLWEFVKKITPDTKQGKLLPASGDKNMIPPDFIINVIYLPALDENDKSKGEPSTTFAIDGGNYQVILRKLAEFLKEKNILPRENGIGQISETTKQNIPMLKEKGTPDRD